LPAPSDLHAEPPLGPLLLLDLAAAVAGNALRAHHVAIQGDFFLDETDEGHRRPRSRPAPLQRRWTTKHQVLSQIWEEPFRGLLGKLALAQGGHTLSQVLDIVPGRANAVAELEYLLSGCQNLLAQFVTNHRARAHKAALSQEL
jgi:hypothetical protein